MCQYIRQRTWRGENGYYAAHTVANNLPDMKWEIDGDIKNVAEKIVKELEEKGFSCEIRNNLANEPVIDAIHIETAKAKERVEQSIAARRKTGRKGSYGLEMFLKMKNHTTIGMVSTKTGYLYIMPCFTPTVNTKYFPKMIYRFLGAYHSAVAPYSVYGVMLWELVATANRCCVTYTENNPLTLQRLEGYHR